MKNFFELFDKRIALFSFLTLLYGNIYLYFYYYHFRINIYSFIDITEVFSLFLPTIIIVGLTSAAPIMIILSYRFLLSIFVSNTNQSYRELKTKYTWFRFIRKWGSYIIVAFVTILNLLISFFIDNETLKNFLIFILFLIIAPLLMWCVFYLGNYFKKRKSFLPELYIFILLTITTSGLYGVFRADLVEEEEHSNLIMFSVNNLTIKTSKSLKLIGNTNKYVFLFDVIKRRTIIYKMEEISSPIMLLNQTDDLKFKSDSVELNKTISNNMKNDTIDVNIVNYKQKEH